MGCAMHIQFINPNTTRSVTEKIARAAERVAAPTTRITACQPDSGPASIECRYDEAFAVPGVLQAVIRAEADGVDAHIVACFGRSRRLRGARDRPRASAGYC
jgi:allantoin racemase